MNKKYFISMGLIFMFLLIYNIIALTTPSIIYPTSAGIKINNGTEINWTFSTDLDIVKYNIFYSNDSGAEWFPIIYNWGYINYLNDSNTSINISFSGNQNQTLYLKVPKIANISSASLNLTGYQITTTPYRLTYDSFLNESGGDGVADTSYQAIGFGRVLTNYPGINMYFVINNTPDLNADMLGILLGPAGSSPQDKNIVYNINIAETTSFLSGNPVDDNTTAYTRIKSNILCSEEWGNAQNVFVNISFDNSYTLDSTKMYILWFEYVSGSTDGAQYSVKFDTNAGITNNYTGIVNGLNSDSYTRLANIRFYNGTKGNISNAWLEVGNDDGIREWNYTGDFTSTNKTNDFNSSLQNYIDNNCTSELWGNCTVPLIFHSDTQGKIEISAINIQFTNYWWNTTSFPELTTYKINITALNSTINGSSDISNNDFTITHNNPNTTLNTPSDNYSNSTSDPVNVVFNCSATDDYSLSNISLYITNNQNISFSLNQTTNITGTLNTTNWTLSLSNGNYTWNCLSYDSIGNNDWAENRTIKINFTSTTVTANITYPLNNTNYTINVSTLNYTVTSSGTLAQCWYSNNSGIWNSTTVAAGTNFTSLTSIEGWNNWTVYCNDTSNSVGSSLVTFFKDTTPPSFTAIANQIIEYQTDLGYDINSSDASGISCFTVNDTTNFKINCSGYLENNTLLSVSLYWLNITVNDTLGNVNSTLMWVNVTDTIVPNVTLNSPTASYVNDSASIINIVFNCSATDDYSLSNISLYITNNQNISFSLNQTTNISGISNTTNWTLSLGVGNYTWNCLAYDSVGNFDWGINRSIKINYTAPAATDSPSGGGGGHPECTKNSDCKNGYYCYNYRCVKLFDVQIIKIDSPLKKEQFFNLTYSVKSIGKINNDVLIEFWLEKNNKKITSGYDTVYFGESEEKINEVNLFLPGNIETGIYDCYVRANYENYNASAKRTVQVESFMKKEIEEEIVKTEIPSEKPTFWHELWNKIKSISKIFWRDIVNNKTYLVLFGVLIIILVLFFLLIKLLLEKIISKNERFKNRIKNLIKKKVYTEEGNYIGYIEEVIFWRNHIDSLRIKLNKKIKARKRIKKIGIIVKYKDIKNINEIVIADKGIEDFLDYMNK